MPFLLAIPAVDAVLLAMICLMMLLAFDPFRHLLSGLLSKLPVIGSAVASWVDNAITDVWSTIAAWLGSFVNGFVDVINALWRPLAAIVLQLEYMFESVFFQLRNIIQNTIPSAVDFVLTAAAEAIDTVKATLSATITTVYDDLATAVAQAISWAQGVFLQLGTEIVDVYNTLQHAISFVGNDIVAWVQTTLSSAISTIYGTVNELISWATQSFATIAAEVSTALGDVTSWVAGEVAALSGMIATAVTDIEQWVQQLLTTGISVPLSQIWDRVAQPAQALQGSITAEYPDIASLNPAIPSTVPLDLASALAGIAAITVPLTEFVNECGMPMCKNLSQYGKDLSELETVVGSGLLLAFVVAAATDPQGISKVFNDTVSPVLQGVGDAVKGMF